MGGIAKPSSSTQFSDRESSNAVSEIISCFGKQPLNSALISGVVKYPWSYTLYFNSFTAIDGSHCASKPSPSLKC